MWKTCTIVYNILLCLKYYLFLLKNIFPDRLNGLNMWWRVMYESLFLDWVSANGKVIIPFPLSALTIDSPPWASTVGGDFDSRWCLDILCLTNIVCLCECVCARTATHTSGDLSWLFRGIVSTPKQKGTGTQRHSQRDLIGSIFSSSGISVESASVFCSRTVMAYDASKYVTPRRGKTCCLSLSLKDTASCCRSWWNIKLSGCLWHTWCLTTTVVVVKKTCPVVSVPAYECLYCRYSLVRRLDWCVIYFL